MEGGQESYQFLYIFSHRFGKGSVYPRIWAIWPETDSSTLKFETRQKKLITRKFIERYFAYYLNCLLIFAVDVWYVKISIWDNLVETTIWTLYMNTERTTTQLSVQGDHFCGRISRNLRTIFSQNKQMLENLILKASFIAFVRILVTSNLLNSPHAYAVPLKYFAPVHSFCFAAFRN